MLVGEVDEILQLVCGQIMNTLLLGGCERVSLWPRSTHFDDYQGFPVQSELQQWKLAFQRYLDAIWMRHATQREA